MARIYILCWALVLAGCQLYSPAEDMLDDYLTRLARVLGQHEPAVVRRPAVTLPAMRDLQVPIEPLSVNLLEYWEFRECGLAPILAERNSVLGRVMPPSQALHMDGRLLRQLAFCATTLQDEAMGTLTQQLIEQKQAQWPLRYWNATVAGPELRHFWSPASAPLAPGVRKKSVRKKSTKKGIGKNFRKNRVELRVYLLNAQLLWASEAASSISVLQLAM